MNVKEAHVVAGMSRDSSVSRQNPNLVYDAHNIRITTKDGKNSLLSVTNEKGTKQVVLTGTITGTPIGSATIGDYVIIFTHTVVVRAEGETEEHYQARLAVCDHIYRCIITSTGATSVIIYEGNANFSLEHPIETLPVFETESIQKVYWVDGNDDNQPRVINIISGCPKDSLDKYITDALNFSRTVSLGHTLKISKCSTGGEFPTGTIQYCFSYYMKNGQETRLIDVSPMYYLSPKEQGLAADRLDHSSFNITITGVDTSFDYMRLYSIIRTSENGTPQCRIVGDYVISGTSITVNDNGVFGRTIEPASLYFIGGEEMSASTLAQKDNTLFLGNIKLKKPTLKDYNGGAPSVSALTVYYDSLISGGNKPTKSNNYYDYNPDNNRSAYYIKRFKYLETYKLGFIAQYKNGQWSEPFFIDNKKNESVPVASSSDYYTGAFKATFSAAQTTALWNMGFRRVAPVVVYPNVIGRRCIAQGLLSPTVATWSDRESNSPFAQSSWFFRFCGTNTLDKKVLPDNKNYEGEIQCMDNYMTTGYVHDPDYDTQGAQNANHFFLNTKMLTVNSPDIECVDDLGSIDFHNTSCYIVGSALLQGSKYRVVDHYLTVENAGINADNSHVIQVKRQVTNTGMKNFCLYVDSMVDSSETEEVSVKSKDKIYGWVVYPWQRQGSLNNQANLSTKQKSSGFTSRTAMLKRNITANAQFANSTFRAVESFSEIAMGGYVPEIFSSDQLAGLRISGGGDSFIYYGNIDKVLTAEDNYYYAKYGWERNTEKSGSDKTATEMSNDVIANPPIYWSDVKSVGDDPGTKVSDPVSMKYKSSPHIVMYCPDGATLNGGTNNSLYIVEFIRNFANDAEANIAKFGNSADATNLNWIRCGNSVPFISGSPVIIDFLQGDCYFQRFDSLKTYPFTNEDTNSIIELFSTTLETYVNLDFRYDRNRGGGNNTALLYTNFNLYNHRAYEQSGNFFTYHGLDYSNLSDNSFPNTITWSLEKTFGEDVDIWTSIDVSNTQELDGNLGELNKLINYNNDIYSFQDVGFAKLLFNSRVQIPTSDGVPIEITNGMKMQGKQYISTKIGCTNKWSIVETPSGLYFIDDILRTTFLFNGQLQDISTAKGMKSWMNERCTNKVWSPDLNFYNCKAFYDKVGKDVYWVYKDIALVYSEVLGQYMSFMDYGGVPLLENAGNSTFAALSVNNEIVSGGDVGKVYVQCNDHADGNIVFTATYTTKPILLYVHVTEPIDQDTYPAATATVEDMGAYRNIYVTIYSSNTNEQEPEFAKYTIGQIVSALTAAIGTYFTISIEGDMTSSDVLDTPSSGRLDFTVGPLQFNTIIPPEQESPFWELGAGNYNMFFGSHKPYWLTLISNSYPTENKIFNNVAWRDIITDNGVTEPFNTFDHIRVWTENQDTQSVRFSNSLSQNPSRQPISYDAAISNLRKKFNVWRAQIPRDKIAPNTNRARISNPWCYIKLSREDIHVERHEIMDIEVDYFM